MMDQAVTRAAGVTPSATPPAAAAPRLVGEFQGYVDGQPSVVWADRKNMPEVGSKLYALPPRTAVPRTWALLLTSPNHGVVGAAGSQFDSVPENYERVQVVEIVVAGAAPAPSTDLAGLVRLPLTNEQIDDAWDSIPAAFTRGQGEQEWNRENRLAFARAIEREVAAQAGQVAATDDHLTEDQKWLLESAEMVRSGGYPELASKIRANCKASVAGQVAVPEKLVADIDAIADELEVEAMNYEGDFADTVKGCAEALRIIVAPSPAKESK